MAPEDWQYVEPAPESLCLKSANGPVCASEMISYQCMTTGEVIDALVMKDRPPVLSIGRRCMLHGWGFYWEPGEAPYIILPYGKDSHVHRRGLRSLPRTSTFTTCSCMCELACTRRSLAFRCSPPVLRPWLFALSGVHHPARW